MRSRILSQKNYNSIAPSAQIRQDIYNDREVSQYLIQCYVTYVYNLRWSDYHINKNVIRKKMFITK